MPETDADRQRRGWGGISCGLFWERSQVSFFFYFFFRRPFSAFADDDERGSVNIKRRFHGLLWKGSARRFERRGSRGAVFLFGKHFWWVGGGAGWRTCLNMKGTRWEATWASAGG